MQKVMFPNFVEWNVIGIDGLPRDGICYNRVAYLVLRNCQ